MHVRSMSKMQDKAQQHIVSGTKCGEDKCKCGIDKSKGQECAKEAKTREERKMSSNCASAPRALTNYSLEDLTQHGNTDIAGAVQAPQEKANIVKTMVLLATAMINVQIGLSMHPCRALCDSGAQLNLMTARCAKRIGAKTFPCNRVVSGIGNLEGTPLSKRTKIDLRAVSNEQYVFTAEFTIIDELTDHMPYVPIPKLGMPEHIILADPEFGTPAQIDLIFDASIWAETLGPKIYRNALGTVLQETDFGYVVFGRVKVHNDSGWGKGNNEHDQQY